MLCLEIVKKTLFEYECIGHDDKGENWDKKDKKRNMIEWLGRSAV